MHEIINVRVVCDEGYNTISDHCPIAVDLEYGGGRKFFEKVELENIEERYVRPGFGNK